MAVRYGVASVSCGTRQIVYGRSRCIEIFEVKAGEIQIFDLNFQQEIACYQNCTTYNCVPDYDQILTVYQPIITPLVNTNGGTATLQLVQQGFPLSVSLDGIVKMSVDLTDGNIREDDTWEVEATVGLKDGRRLKQCLRVKAINCTDVTCVNTINSTIFTGNGAVVSDGLGVSIDENNTINLDITELPALP